MSNPEKDIKALMKKLSKVRDEVIKDIEEVGDEAANLIRKRTKLGYGVSEQGGKKKKLTPLSENYIKRRKSFKLGETTPKRSNLTLSGQMLDDLHAKKKKDNSVEITFKSEEAKDKAKWNTDKGRPFNFLSSSEIKQVREIIQKKIQNLIKKIK